MIKTGKAYIEKELWRHNMKNHFTLWLAVSAVVMLAFPWMAVTFVKGDGGMAVCFLLFFAVNPVYSVMAGWSAGKDIRNLWSIPIISAGLFFAGTWLFFDMGETAFILYAAVYLVLGTAGMLFSMFALRVCHACFHDAGKEGSLYGWKKKNASDRD